MKKSFGIALLLVLGSMANAGSINLEMRDDLTSTGYNDAALATGVKNNYKFNIQTLRVDGKGNLSEALSYRLRFRLNKTAVTAKNRETGNDWVDMAYLSNKFSDTITMTAGKFNSDIGGWEGLTSGSDIYMASKGYAQISNLLYHDGIKLGLNFEGQSFDFEVANQEYDSMTNGNFDQNRSVYGLVYKGSFMDKSLLPVVSYFNSPQSTGTNAGSGATTDTSKYAYTNLGVRYTVSSLTADVDYGIVDKKETVNATTDRKYTNTVVKVGYKMDSLTPCLKWYSTADKTTASGAETTDNYDGLELSAEYKPVSDLNMRYHVAVSSENKKPATGDTQTTQTMIAGLKIYADFLK